MKISRAVSQIQIGEKLGGEIKERIINAKDKIVIISPWISEKFVELLQSKAKDVDHKILLYEDERNYFSLRRFVKKKINLKEFVINFILSLFSISLFFYLIFYFLSSGRFIFLVLSGLILVSFFLFLVNLRESFRVEMDLNIKVQSKNDPRFLHLKAYLIDKTLYLGSANLTESGMYHNIESMMRYDDHVVIEEFLRFVDSLEHKLEYISLEDFIKRYAVRTKFISLFRR